MSTTRKRNIPDDLIRIIMIIMVIMIHTDDKPWTDIPVLSALVTTLIFSCNSLFFQLSGKYSLRHTFNERKDYLIYYKKKLIDIVFPYVCTSLLLSIWNMQVAPDPEINASSQPMYYLKFAFKELFSTNNSIHLWFMFLLMGFILSAPFLSKMLHAMSRSEMNILFALGILWNIVRVFLFMDFYKPYAYSGWILTGWILHFCMGYYIANVVDDNNRPRYLFAGLAGLVINILGMTLIPHRFYEPTDQAPTFILFCGGLYIALSHYIRIKKETAEKVILFLAAHTFTVYMIHFNIAHYVTPLIVHVPSVTGQYFLSVIVTYLISLIIAVILDSIYSLCKKGLYAVSEKIIPSDAHTAA